MEKYYTDIVKQFYEVPGVVIKIKKGQFLFHEGAEAKYFFFVMKGQIRITKYVNTGKELSLRLTSKDSIIGELPLFQQKPIYIFNAIAEENSEVYAITFPVLEEYLNSNLHLAVDLLKMISEHMRKQHLKFRDLVLYGKKGALCSTLIRLCNSYGKKTKDGIVIEVVLTNQELANYSATARESLNRMLNELKKQEVIGYVGNYIIVKNIQYLRNEINCEMCDASICNIE